MRPWSSRRLRVLALLVVVLATMTTACGSSPESSATPPDARAPGSGPGRAECGGAPPPDVQAGQSSPVALLDALGTPRAPVSYVFVVDTSRSMREGDRYGRLRSELRAFLAALCPDDQVAAITFADTARTAVRLGSLKDNGDLVDRLPRRADGALTDIGAALSRALDEVDAVPAGRWTSVVLLSDGQPAPPRASPYRDPEAEAWTMLTDRAAAATPVRPLQAFAVPLVGSSGVEALTTVFPDAQDLTASGPTAPLREVLGRAQQKVRLQQATPLLDREDGTGVAVEWPALDAVDLGERELVTSMRLRNTSPVFPVTVQGAALTADGDVGVVADPLPPELSLAAGQSLAVPVHLRWPLPRRAGLLPGRGEYTSTLTLGGTVVSHTADGLARLADRSPITTTLVDDTTALTGPGRVDLDVVSWLALLALVVLVVALLQRRFPRLRGVLDVTVADPDDDQRTLLLGTVALECRRRVVRTAPAAVPGQLSLPGFNLRIAVRGHRSWRSGVVRVHVDVRLRPADRRTGAPTRRGRHDVPLEGSRMIVGLTVAHRTRAGSTSTHLEYA